MKPLGASANEAVYRYGSGFGDRSTRGQRRNQPGDGIARLWETSDDHNSIQASRSSDGIEFCRSDFLISHARSCRGFQVLYKLRTSIVEGCGVLSRLRQSPDESEASRTSASCIVNRCELLLSLYLNHHFFPVPDDNAPITSKRLIQIRIT